MKIVQLTLTEGLDKRVFKFKQRTLVFSEKNTQGKTSLIRSILYALGFHIPNIGKLKFSSITTDLVLKDETIDRLMRNDNEISCVLNTGEVLKFTLPEDKNRLHGILFKTDRPYLIENVLGSFYIDQTRGTVVLNRGDVIGSNAFNVDRLIAGFEDTDILELTTELERIRKNNKDYKSLKKIAEYKIEQDIKPNEIKTKEQSNLDYFEEKRILESKIKDLTKKIRHSENSLENNNTFIHQIENYHLYVEHRDDKIPVNKTTLKGFSDKKSILEVQIKMLKIDKKALEIKFEELKINNRNNNHTLFQLQDYKETIDQTLGNVTIEYDTISELVEQTEKEISNINKRIREKVTYNSEVLQFINDKIMDITKRLGVDSYIEKKIVLTNKVQDKSGAIFSKVIIAFKIAFILTWEKYLGVKLPLIIDSLRNNELDDENADEILNIIKEELKENQVILASIFKYKDFFDSEIILDGLLIENKE